MLKFARTTTTNCVATTRAEMMIIMKQREISVLYLDDELDNLASFKANFRREFNVFTASNVEAAMEIIKNNEIHEMEGLKRAFEVVKICTENE